MSHSVVFIVNADKVMRSQLQQALLFENCSSVGIAMSGVSGGTFTVTASSDNEQELGWFADNVRKYLASVEALLGEYSPDYLAARLSQPARV